MRSRGLRPAGSRSLLCDWWHVHMIGDVGIVISVLIIGCVHVLSGAAVGGGSGGGGGGAECASVQEFLRNEFLFNGSSSQFTGGHAFAAPPSNQHLCAPSPHEENSTSPSQPPASSSTCCPLSMVEPFVKSSNVLLSTFNNSEQLSRFKTKISMYETVINSHESSNAELWNATIHGLKVLRNWGLKYWDPLYLHRNNVFSNECLTKVVQTRVCGGCQTRVVKPCKSLCHNVVIGCIKSPLAEYIESPWKHAVNSVRTAIRLESTTGGDAIQNTQPLQDLVADLNDWREPITWWVPDYKRTAGCESLPITGCWNGNSVAKYDFGTVTWKSSYNPEFSSVYTGDTGNIHSNVIVELDRFRNELVGVRKSLEKFWPTTPHQQKVPSPPHALALSSSEAVGQPHSSYINDLVHETGSGDDSFESDDEDLEYINSGYGPAGPIDSDDEDLNGYGSGSGDEPTTHFTDVSVDTDEDKDTDSTPISLNRSGNLGVEFSVLVCCLATVLLAFKCSEGEC